MEHLLKIQEPYANAVADGRKTFEVRFNDRGYQAGDTIKFYAVLDRSFTMLRHPIYGRTFQITYVHSGLGMADGYVVLAIKEI